MLPQGVAHQTPTQLLCDSAVVQHGRLSAPRTRRGAQRLAVQGFRDREDATASRSRPASEPRHASANRGRGAGRAVQTPSQQRPQQLRFQHGGDGSLANVATLEPLPVLRRVAWRLMGRGARHRTTSRERDSIDAATRGAAEAAEQAAAARTDPTGVAVTPIGRFGLSSARVRGQQSNRQMPSQSACAV